LSVVLCVNLIQVFYRFRVTLEKTEFRCLQEKTWGKLCVTN